MSRRVLRVFARTVRRRFRVEYENGDKLLELTVAFDRVLTGTAIGKTGSNTRPFSPTVSATERARASSVVVTIAGLPSPNSAYPTTAGQEARKLAFEVLAALPTTSRFSSRTANEDIRRVRSGFKIFLSRQWVVANHPLLQFPSQPIREEQLPCLEAGRRGKARSRLFPWHFAPRQRRGAGTKCCSVQMEMAATKLGRRYLLRCIVPE